MCDAQVNCCLFVMFDMQLWSCGDLVWIYQWSVSGCHCILCLHSSTGSPAWPTNDQDWTSPG